MMLQHKPVFTLELLLDLLGLNSASKNYKAEPGIELKIAGIDTAITEEHHHNFYYWAKHKLNLADLLRIDGHNDMADFVPLYGINSPEYYKRLDILNFNSPAVHIGLIGNILWLNPHSRYNRLIDYGTVLQNRLGLSLKKLNTIQRPFLSTELDGKMIRWAREYCRHMHDLVSGEDLAFEIYSRLSIDRELLLDIDLDAFACDKHVDGAMFDYDGIKGYETRIADTVQVLCKLKRPRLITITRSQGEESYIPNFIVDRIQELTIRALTELYSK